jgi:hypothetical protein
LPVDNCLDDGSAGTLRSVLAGAAEGDTIDLTALTCSTITLTQGPLNIASFGTHPIDNVILQGPGRDALMIEAGGLSMVFLSGSDNPGTVSVNDLTIANGSYHLGLPGCIASAGGTLALNRVAVTNCQAINTYAVFGGALFATTLEMTDSAITNSNAVATNSLAMGGGAFVTVGATLIRSTISGNSVSAALAFYSGYFGSFVSGGGGLYSGGPTTIVDSTISGNTVEATTEGQDANGGGVHASGAITVGGSTIDANVTDGDGGGLYKAVSGRFSGPTPPDTQVEVNNSTFSGNSALHGGGIASTRPVLLSNSTIAFNSASEGGGGVMFRLYGITGSSGVLDAQSSIIASNTTTFGALFPADLAADADVAMSGANNLIIAADAAIMLPPDTLFTDPQLLPLAPNGGPTLTHALAEGSPAIDTGANPGALEFDQRGDGYARESGSAADIGAFEVQQLPPDDVVFKDGFDGPDVRATAALSR